MREHRFVDMNEVRSNLDEPWDKLALSCNGQLTVKDVETLILPNCMYNWDWGPISKYINIQEVRNNPNKPWNKHWLSTNKQLTVKDIETLILPNSMYDWCWGDITQFINIQEVINNPNKPWDKRRLKSNKGVTNKILEFFKVGLLKYLQKNIPQFRYHTDIVVKCEC